MVRERLRIHQQAGVTTLRVAPEGETLSERLDVLGQLVDLVNEVEMGVDEENILQ